MIIDNPSLKHIPALRRLWKQAFDDTDVFLDSFFETGFSCSRCRCVFSEGEPVAVVYFFDCEWESEKTAYLYALAVDARHRGQGLSRLLLADTHARLQQSGYRGCMMEPATENLLDYYCRLGYRPFGARQEIVAVWGDEEISVSQVGELAYSQARRELLPPGGVLQEGAMTAFFHSQAHFYTGEGFAAAVSESRDFLPEFLGDFRKIPAFLRTLGINQAQVRIPGNQQTAVYLDFFGSDHTPSYFGFPLD